MRYELQKKYSAVTKGFVIAFITMVLSSCSTPQDYPPTSPEAHTKNFLQALFENPVK